jgi:epoxyqueuosine reductase
MPVPDQHLTDFLKNQAHQLGFQLAGVCDAVSPLHLDEFHQWLSAGYAGQMHYLPDRSEAYKHPDHVLDGVRSILMLGMAYPGSSSEPPAAAGSGRVASYARGSDDYHDLIHQRLGQLTDSLLATVPTALARGVVDTAPLLERDFAQLAGLGWIAKNTMLIHREMGSWFFLAALLTDQPLVADNPFTADHCGSCRACLDACPTDAFPEPYVLDATRCISYLTIELRNPVPRTLRGPTADWVFGCDICQQVCPWNNPVTTPSEAAFEPRDEFTPLDLVELFELDEQSFRDRFRTTPMWRSRRRGMLRNAAIVLGNQRHQPAIAALTRGLHDEESLVRGASAWALGELDSAEAKSGLLARLPSEKDPHVREEIRQALGMADEAQETASGEPPPGVTSP